VPAAALDGVEIPRAGHSGSMENPQSHQWRALRLSCGTAALRTVRRAKLPTASTSRRRREAHEAPRVPKAAPPASVRPGSERAALSPGPSASMGPGTRGDYASSGEPAAAGWRACDEGRALERCSAEREARPCGMGGTARVGALPSIARAPLASSVGARGTMLAPRTETWREPQLLTFCSPGSPRPWSIYVHSRRVPFTG
jgi:hypothetical protein